MPGHRSRWVLFMLFTTNMMVAIVKGLSYQIANMSDTMCAKDNVNVIQIG